MDKIYDANKVAADQAWQQRDRTPAPKSDHQICQEVYRETIDTAVGSLTVRQTELVQACRVAGLYTGELK